MLSRLRALIKKEFLSIWHDPKSRMIILFPPIIQLLIFANVLTMEVRNIDIIAADYSDTLESRELIAGLEGSVWFNKVTRTKDTKEIENLIKAQKADAAIIIADDFSTRLKKGQPAEIQLILDGRTTNVAAAVNGYVSQIAARYSQKLTQKEGVSGAAVAIEARSWFNPNAIYQWYLLITLISILALVITLILTALSVARERELGTFEQLIVSPYNSFEILVGKTVPPLCFSLVMVSVMTFIAVYGFGIPFTGSFPLFLFSCFTALLSFVGIGLFISSVSQNQQQAILGAFAFMMPAILLSGFISPIEDMPQALQYLTYLNPVRFFMSAARGLFLKEMPAADVLTNLAPLFVIALITLTLAGRTFKKNLE
ncbi:MAG: ABC transporter permease [Alphaproteobacteria bacterium]|nr:ABC transporter permease [Alphaproteobacteria bacterium]